MVQVKLSITLILAAAAAVIAQPHLDHVSINNHPGSTRNHLIVQTAQLPGRGTNFYIHPGVPFVGSISSNQDNLHVLLPTTAHNHVIIRGNPDNPNGEHVVKIFHHGPLRHSLNESPDGTIIKTLRNLDTQMLTKFVVPPNPQGPISTAIRVFRTDQPVHH